MANYNVDDILEEVRRKKAAAGLDRPSGASAEPRPPAPAGPAVKGASTPTPERPAAPFRLPGLTEEFEAPARPAAPSPRAAPEAASTRVDLPSRRPRDRRRR
jgi:hypothetical protein